MEDRKPLHEAIYRDVLDEYQAREGMTFEEVKTGVESEYTRRVKAYKGDEYPAFEGEGVDPESLKRREAFKRQKQAQGRL